MKGVIIDTICAGAVALSRALGKGTRPLSWLRNAACRASTVSMVAATVSSASLDTLAVAPVYAITPTVSSICASATNCDAFATPKE